MAFEHVASGTGSDQDMLDAVRASIQQVVVNGQEYRDANGNRQLRADLGELRQLEHELQSKVSAVENGPATNLVVLGRR